MSRFVSIWNETRFETRAARWHITCLLVAVIDSLARGRSDRVLWSVLQDRALRHEERWVAIAGAAEAGLWERAREQALAWVAGGEHVESGPLVSLVIPTFNRPASLRTALASVAAQLYRPIEVVVVNDAGCSVSALCDQFRDRLDLRYVEHEQNQYLASARNSGIERASGQLIGYLDDDDRLYPHHLGHLVYLLQQQRAGAACSRALIRRRSAEGGRAACFKPHPWRAFELALLLEENVTPVLTVLHERALVEQIGRFDPLLRTNEDWDFWIRLRQATRVAESKVVTCGVDAMHAARMSNTGKSSFLPAHQSVYARYHELSRESGGAELLAKQRALLDSLAAPAAAPSATRTHILCYHRVDPNLESDPFALTVTPSTFEAQLVGLKQQFRLIDGDEFLSGSPASDPRERVLLTFDDAYRDFYRYAWPLLRKHKIPAILFVPTGFIDANTPYWWEVLAAAGRAELQESWKRLPPAERHEAQRRVLTALPARVRQRLTNLACSWEMLREIASDGLVELGGHTRWHSSLGALGRREIEAEVDASTQDLLREIGAAPRFFAFPHGGPQDISPTAFEVITARGFSAAFATKPGPLGVARAIVSEIPVEKLIDTLTAQAAASTPTRRQVVVLSGISASNLGDDAMLIATVRELQRLDSTLDITVLAEHPEACGPVAAQIEARIVRSLQRFVARDLTTLYPHEPAPKRVLLLAQEIIRHKPQILAGRAPLWLPEQYREGLVRLLHADAVVDCGGANLTGHWPSFFYEKCLDYLIAAKPLLITGQGIDRLPHAADEVLLKAALARACEVTVREAGSEQYLKQLGVTPPVATTGDDAIALEPAPLARAQAILRSAGIDPEQPFIAFQYRHYLDHADESVLRTIASCIDASIAITGWPVVGIPMHFDQTDERQHLELLAPLVAQRTQFVPLVERLTPVEAKSLFAAAECAFGISYHSAIFALSSGVPFLGLYRGAHYQQKLQGIAQLFEFPELPLPLDGLTVAQFEQRLHWMLENKAHLRPRFEARTAQIYARTCAPRRRWYERFAAAPSPAPPPPRTPIDWGALRTMKPVSQRWGFDRGLPLDRWFIEGFLESHRERICGVVAEIGDDQYARRFGQSNLTRVEIIDIDPQNRRATRVADLTQPDSLPEGAYDALILTQVLPHLSTPHAAVSQCYRALKPGGTLLLTVPSIIRYSAEPADHWRFTADSVRDLIARCCPGAESEVGQHGNLVLAIGFLIGAACEDLSPDELAHHDPRYPISITARITKPASSVTAI
jgi:polysaccharide pyruvyl transferase WcaK-like protein/SAM-dependent methyltransferase